MLPNEKSTVDGENHKKIKRKRNTSPASQKKKLKKAPPCCAVCQEPGIEGSELMMQECHLHYHKQCWAAELLSLSTGPPRPTTHVVTSRRRSSTTTPRTFAMSTLHLPPDGEEKQREVRKRTCLSCKATLPDTKTALVSKLTPRELSCFMRENMRPRLQKITKLFTETSELYLLTRQECPIYSAPRPTITTIASDSHPVDFQTVVPLMVDIVDVIQQAHGERNHWHIGRIHVTLP